jgi:hypothetical protein
VPLIVAIGGDVTRSPKKWATKTISFVLESGSDSIKSGLVARPKLNVRQIT